MKRVKSRLFIYFMCCMLLVSSMPVYAAIDNDTLSLAQFHFSQLGFITKDWDWFLENDAFLDYISKIEDGTYFFIDDDGFYNFRTEASAAARAIIDSYIDEQTGGSVSDHDYGDYYILPTFSYSDVWEWVNTFSSGWDVDDRNALIEITNTSDWFLFTGRNFSYTDARLSIYVPEFQNCHYVYNSLLSASSTMPQIYTMYLYGDDGKQLSTNSNEIYTANNIYFKNSDENYVNTGMSKFGERCVAYPDCTSETLAYAYLNYWFIVTRNGESIKVWKDAYKLSAYLTGTWTKPKYYTMSSFADFDVSQDNSFSIDQQTYNNIKGNFNTVNQQFSQVIDDINIQNNSSITYNQLQQIIDNSITNIVNNYYYIIVDPEEPETETGPGNQEVLDKLDEQSKQDKEFREEDLEGASSAGDAMGTFASDLESGIYNQWKILWFPIEFTETILSAFEGSSGSTYSMRYEGITGYTYDSESGTLQPVYSKSRGMPGIPSVSSGTVLTFPEYTLPGLNIKLWDAYQYDLTVLTIDYPLIFDALYVLCCVLETVWFVEFLHRKFMEVFTR